MLFFKNITIIRKNLSKILYIIHTYCKKNKKKDLNNKNNQKKGKKRANMQSTLFKLPF